jgi:hypothetical protein
MARGIHQVISPEIVWTISGTVEIEELEELCPSSSNMCDHSTLIPPGHSF